LARGIAVALYGDSAMKIVATAVVLPSRSLSNEDVVSEIGTLSKGRFCGDLDRTLHKISLSLRRSGARSRRWRSPGETSLQLTTAACRQAMSKLAPGERVDLLISAAVYAELAEPASANVLAHEIGLDDVECFDLKQACDGWSKAVRIASAFVDTGTYRNVMIVNAEFPMTAGFGIYPQLFQLERADQLEYRFPGYTLGEAAAAMIVASDPANHWQFHNHSRNDLYDLCTISMPWFNEQPLPSTRVAKDGPGVFTSYGADLRKHGMPLAVDAFRCSDIEATGVDILFSHSSSKADWAEGARRVGLANRIYDIYAECGNVVSAAVPAAMALAEARGNLKRGQRVATWVASAGMSFTTAYFQF
jgi:3-oxoacyl-[acyl-carrier-protein] synthase III